MNKIRVPPTSVLSFETELSENLSSFFKKIPIKTVVTRVLSDLYVRNFDTDGEVVHRVDYDISVYENVYRLELKILEAGWYPTLEESYPEFEPLTLEGRQELLSQGLSFEEAYSAKGTEVMRKRTWVVRRVKLLKDTLTAYHGSERLIVKFKTPISEFLKLLRSGEISSSQGWEIAQQQEVKIVHAL